MDVALRPSMTIAEFLDWEERQELRYEFDGFQPVAMTGGTTEHNAIVLNLAVALANRLRGRTCKAHEGLKFEVMGRIRYPDAFVTCTPFSYGSTVLSEPVVIFEVLSESTARTDRIFKNREYAATASVKRYVMLEQDAIAATMFERIGDDSVGNILNADAVIRMPEIGIEIPLADFYEGVEFAPE